MKAVFIGGGNMACALIGGLLDQGWARSDLRVVELLEAQREALRSRFGIQVGEVAGAGPGETVVLAVKPQQLRDVARQLAPTLSGQLVISIAAGIRAADIGRWLGNHRAVVRAMPNTPALVRQGITGLYALPEVGESQRHGAERILGAAGPTLWLDSEQQMDAITAVSGSGPAYVFYFIEALEQAATELGFAPQQARTLALETFHGAAVLARDSGEAPAVLRARVTSKGGTTERALLAMEARDVKSHIVAAVRAAAERARELGDELGKDA